MDSIPNQNNIYSIIRSEIDDFLYNDIEPVPGWSFNQYQTIRKSHLYINSKFVDDSLYQGRKKIFNNLVRPVRDTAAKYVQFDTKDIRIKALNEVLPYKTMLLNKELEQYNKNNNVAQILNDIAEEITTYGSVVLKKTSKGVQIVDLRNLFIDPTVNNLQESRFITLKHRLTVSQLRKKVKDGWDKDAVEAIIAWKKRQGNSDDAGQSYEDYGQLNVIRSTPYIDVYERYGEVEKQLLDEKLIGKPEGEDLVKALFIVAEPYSVSQKENGDYLGENGKILFKSEWKKDKFPFDEAHYSKTRGRWLGVGPVEVLFPVQERYNELANQKRISMEISTIHLFQTAERTIVSNVLDDLRNGSVIFTGPNGRFEPVINEERNLAAFTSEESYYRNLGDRLSLLGDQAFGQALPSTTPATNAVIQQNNTISFFIFRRQNVGNMIRRFYNENVLPDLVKAMSPAHVLKYSGSIYEIQKLDMATAEAYAFEEFKKRLLSGRSMSQEQYQAMIQGFLMQLSRRGFTERLYDIKELFYSDVEMDFDINVDNEQEDVAVMANNYKEMTMLASQAPQLMQNPVSKLLLYEWAERVGVSPTKLSEAEALMGQMPQQGGSVPNAQTQTPEIAQGATRMEAVGSRQATTI